MLRIPTFLRDAFERPPEREGREVWFARDAEGEPKPSTISGGEAEDEREPPAPEGKSDHGHEPPTGNNEVIQAGTVPPEKRERKKPIDPEQLVRIADRVLKHMNEVMEIFSDDDFQKLLQKAESYDQGQQWITNMEESKKFCEDNRRFIEDLKEQAEQFVAWKKQILKPRDLAATNIRARQVMLAQAQDTEEVKEKKRRAIDAQFSGVNAYLDDPRDPSRTVMADARWTELDPNDGAKKSIIEQLEKRTNIHGRWGEDETWEQGTLEEMDGILTAYDESLNEFLADLEAKRDTLEPGEEKEHDESHGGHGFDWNIKLIHIVHFGMAIKKIWNAYKHQWEHDMEKAASDLAVRLGKPFMPTNAYQTLVDEVEGLIRKEAGDAEHRFEHMSFTDLFPQGTFHKEHTAAENMAKLKVAARRGFLYKIDEEFSTLKIYGTPLKDLLPEHWSTEKIKVYYLDLQGQNRSAGQQEIQKGAAEARGFLHDAFAVAQMKTAIEEGFYWKAAGIAEWVMLSRVGSGKGGTAILETVRRLMVENEQFGKLVPAELIKNIGGIAEKGIPEVALFHLKQYKEDLINLKKYPSAKRKMQKIMKMGDVISNAQALRHRLTGTGGKTLVDVKEVYNTNELLMFERTHTWPSDAEILDQAVATVLAGHPLKTTDGRWISIYDETDTALTQYREEIGRSQLKIDIHAPLKEFDMGHFIYMNEGKMLPAETIKDLFSYSPFQDELTANRGGSRLTAYLEGIANFYNAWETRVQDKGAPRAPLDTFKNDMSERLRLGVGTLKGSGGEHHIPLLIQSIKRTTPKIPQWLNDLLLDTPAIIRPQRPI